MHLLTKNFCVTSEKPQIENFPISPLLIYNKISIWRWAGEIFINKVDFGGGGLFSKTSTVLVCQSPTFDIFLYLSKNEI